MPTITRSQEVNHRLVSGYKSDIVSIVQENDVKFVSVHKETTSHINGTNVADYVSQSSKIVIVEVENNKGSRPSYAFNFKSSDTSAKSELIASMTEGSGGFSPPSSIWMLNLS